MNSIEGESRRTLLSVIIFLGSIFSSFSQTIVKGTVRDALTQQPLQEVTVIFKGGKGVTTDQSGNYTLASNQAYHTIIVSYVGYKSISKPITPNTQQVVDLSLEIADMKNTVIVHSKRG